MANGAALRYIPIPKKIVDEVRRTQRDRFGHRVEILIDNGPCRSCLRYSNEPEPFILMSYQPLPDRNPYAEIGPIFIHAPKACEPYSRTDVFPETFSTRSLVLRAYDYNGFIVTAEVSEPGEASQVAARLLEDAGVAEVHVRHVSYTCYDFKITRSE